ncbi:hypothetical protein INR49_002750 [Caranx melampygus]|nr:hypothetical protein INR49_002750 [Caranx melampygus]
MLDFKNRRRSRCGGLEASVRAAERIDGAVTPRRSNITYPQRDTQSPPTPPILKQTMVSVGKVLLGVFGVAVVVILIAVPTAIYLKGGNKNHRTFTLEDVFNSTLKPKSYSLMWISDHEYLRQANGSVYRHDVLTGQAAEFLSKDKFTQRHAYDYQLSADHKYVAFVSNHTKHIPR